MVWRGLGGNDLFFSEIDLAASCMTETAARRSGDFQIEKHHVALGTIANMQCGSQKPTSLRPLFYSILKTPDLQLEPNKDIKNLKTPDL